MSSTPQTISQFHVAMQEAHNLAAKVGWLVTDQLSAALEALQANDIEAARKVTNKDDKVDALEMQVDKACTEILARYSPVAGDLRMVVVILKAITDLERIGDEASHIAEQVCVGEAMPTAIKNDINSLGDEVMLSLRQLMKHFDNMRIEHANVNPDDSRNLVSEDEEINRHADKLIETTLRSGFGEGSSDAQNTLSIIWCARSLERIGDHIKNISQYLIYFAEGVDIRH